MGELPTRRHDIPPADRLRTALAALTIPVDDKTAPKLIRLSARLREIEREAAWRDASPVFAPIKMTDVFGPDLRVTLGPNSKVQPASTVEFAEVDLAEVRAAADSLSKVFAALQFPGPVIEAAPCRRETA